MLDKFLSILEQDGLKFTRNELIPGFLIMCRIEKDRGGLTVIGGNDRHDPDGGPERLSGSANKTQGSAGEGSFLHSSTGR